MKFFFVFTLFILFSTNSFGNLIRPNPDIDSIEVVKIQLEALKKNNFPYQNAGIEQTWEFAHPLNRIFTGPLEKFILMMHSDSYAILLEHENHNIELIKKDNFIAIYFVQIVDKIGNKFGFTWTVEKIKIDSIYKNCWMTSSVSQPLHIAKSA